MVISPFRLILAADGPFTATLHYSTFVKGGQGGICPQERLFSIGAIRHGTPKEQSRPLTILYTKCYHHPTRRPDMALCCGWLKTEENGMLHAYFFAFTFPVAFAPGHIGVS
jgi:hypothetical protein